MKITVCIITLITLFISPIQATEFDERDVAELKLTPVLSAVKQGVQQRDVAIFADYVSFPLNISSADKYIAADGTVKLKTKKIHTADELQAQFEHVFTPTVIRLIDCISPKNMMYNPYKGFDAAYGGIWFFDMVFERSGKRIFALASISTNKAATEKWIKLNCGLVAEKQS